MKVGTKVKVVKVEDKKYLHIEGANAIIVGRTNSVLFAETEDGSQFSFDKKGRMGIVCAEYTRKDEAEVYKYKLEELRKEYEEAVSIIKETVTRLENFNSDKEYEESKFKEAVLKAIK